MEHITFHFRHVLPIQIRFNDVDMMGHVNNAKLQEYFDLGRVHYFRDVFGGPLFEGDYALVIASNKTDFFFPVLFTNSVVVKTTVYNLGNKSLKMMQHICRVEDGAVVTSCDSVMVCFLKQSSETVPVPESWRLKISEFEEHK